MIINLFSTFDPCTGIISLNWLRSILIFSMLNFNFWVTNNNIEILFNKIILIIHKEIILIIKLKGSSIFFVTIFIIIIFNNICGLLPYVFTSSSHLLFSLSLALPSWLTYIIYGWTFKTKTIYIHLIPIGTPYLLIPFIVIIETIRNLIRPGSLAVRLSANIIAGHLLMSLLGNRLRIFETIIFITIFIILITFEFAVRIIQSYVFTVLSSLYSREI